MGDQGREKPMGPHAQGAGSIEDASSTSRYTQPGPAALRWSRVAVIGAGLSIACILGSTRCKMATQV